MIKNKKILIVTECFYPEKLKINELASKSELFIYIDEAKVIIYDCY